MAFKMKGFSGFKSKNESVEAAAEYAGKKLAVKGGLKGLEKLATTAGKKAFAKGAAKVALKGAARFIPGVGQALMVRDLYKGGKYLANKLRGKSAIGKAD